MPIFKNKLYLLCTVQNEMYKLFNLMIIITKRYMGYTLPNLSPSPKLYKVHSVYNNNVAL